MKSKRLMFLGWVRMIAAVTACVSVLSGLGAGSAAAAAPQVTQVRLYTLDCGHATFKDMGMFSDTGEYDGKTGKVADPCFVIVHPKGVLLWDTGLGDGVAAHPEGVDPIPGIHISVPITLAGQLSSLGMTPADVTFVAFSHFHFDHTGNANLFTQSTWIVNQNELNWGLSAPKDSGVATDSWSAYKTAKTVMITGDYDVFGDGKVRILRAPGHTPGHQVLELQLSKTGTVVLSGDLYHLKANRQFKRIPVLNTERADTLASFDRIETIVRNKHARLIVQHDPQEFDALPKLPAYLD
jgi:glyoxylase-like metal-dependent hydrolase (beta-lactamase superfamily II)